ncbi:hypothetical protein [Ruegeria halocynthiae]|uniref:hypothetical protein n=1 Tax=Ruegeria halocynthiae TaxID=985054 RepID=UPI00056A57A4|nr:hypothetical protein [Ruegeria halocynthiae]
MTLNLIDWGKRAISLLPDMTEDDDLYDFTAKMFPEITKAVEFSELSIRRGIHEYMDTLRVDYLQISATKDTYQVLGLAILAAAFQAEDVWITLTNEKTDFKFLSISGSDMASCGGVRGRVALKEWSYTPRERTRHPFFADKLAEYPAFCLECSDEDAPLPDVWDSRDTVVGFGRLEPSLELAGVLLDMARPSNSRNEFVLEGPAGFQGVDALSAEVRFWLPGAAGYDL